MNKIKESSSGYRIIACDFDGTITKEHNFPHNGPPNMNTVNALLNEQENGSKIVLWTCRTDDDRGNYLSEAVEYCSQLGIVFDAINDDIPEYRGFQKSRKILATEYWDDRAVHVNDIVEN